MSLSCVHSAGFWQSAMVGYTVHFAGLCLHHSFGRLVHCLSTPQEENQTWVKLTLFRTSIHECILKEKQFYSYCSVLKDVIILAEIACKILSCTKHLKDRAYCTVSEHLLRDLAQQHGSKPNEKLGFFWIIFLVDIKFWSLTLWQCDILDLSWTL